MSLYRVGAEAADAGGLVRIPFMLPTLCAGFPSPAEDFIEGALELPRWLVPNPPATFIWRVRGWCMKGAGIHDEDLAVVDRSLSPSSGNPGCCHWVPAPHRGFTGSDARNTKWSDEP